MSKNNATKRLEKARKLRQRMGAQLRELSDGRRDIIETLERPPAALGRCRIYDVLRRTPKLGNEGAKKILQRTKVWPEDRLGQLDLVTRQRIIDELPPRVTHSVPHSDPGDSTAS